jgi:acetyl-CoA C-acetyltransferase
VGHVVFGHVIHTNAHDMYLARVAAINGGLSNETPALMLNRLCGSGLQAIVSAAQAISIGDTKVALGGGAEVMSRSQYWLPGARWGQHMGDGKVIDAMVGALIDPFDDCHMGMTAENIATRWNITRQAQDELALQSYQWTAQTRTEVEFRLVIQRHFASGYCVESGFAASGHRPALHAITFDALPTQLFHACPPLGRT